MINNITFDLDGTLVDSFKTIYKTTVRSLEYLNIFSEVDENEFYKLIGYHFIDIFKRLHIPVNDFNEFISVYKKFYFDYIDDSVIFNGLIGVLESLKEKNIYVSLLTTKAQDQADKIIDHFNLRKYFSVVMGRRNGVADKPAAEPLLIISNQLNVSPGNILMAGDTELDIRCGKNAGAKTCGCFYGYRSKIILQEENPDYLIGSIEEIMKIVGEENNY